MTASQKLQIKASEQRSRLNELSGLDTLTDDQRGELDTLTTAYADTERQTRAAVLAEDGDKVETHATTLDTQGRERVRLRQRATLGGYLAAAAAGRLPGGELAEYASACGSEDGQIPLDLFESDRPAIEKHDDAITPAPSTGTGASLHPVQPYVFADTIAARLGIAMPSAPSGSHSWARISTPLTAGAKTKGAAAESTAAVLSAVSTSPRRISARLSVEAEDLASIGTTTFEPALRSNLTGALSNSYDEQCVNGSGTAPAVDGLLHQLTRPDNPTAVVDFDSLLATAASYIDGTWARTLRDLTIVTNVATYQKSITTFRDGATDHKGSEAASTYLSRVLGMWTSAARMPDAPATGETNAGIAPAIVRRTGRSLLAAVHPTWGSLSIDDIFSDSASARRHYSLHVLVGAAVLIIQPGRVPARALQGRVMEFAYCPEPDCGAPAVLLTDTLAICSADGCAWSCIVSRKHRRDAGLWFEHLDPGRGWGRRWCSAQEVP